MTGCGASPSGTQTSARWLLAVITFTYTIGFIDRQVINLLVVPIKNDFGITDTQVSLLQGLAFMGAYIAMSPIFGRLADTGNRRKILTGAAFVWTLFTAAAAFSKGYWHLFLARFGVGAAEAAISPTAWSMVADSFEPRRLPRALSIFMIAPYLGGGLALLFGGVVLKAMEGWDLSAVPLIGGLAPWQLTILIVSLPGLLAVALMMTTREPQRRVAATSDASVPSLTEVGRALVAKKAFYGPFYLGMSLIIMTFYAFPAWVPTLLNRRFGVPLPQIGLEYGTVVIITGCVGVLSGPAVANFLMRRGYEDAFMRLPMLASIAIIPVCVLLYFAPNYYVALAAAGLGSLFYSMPQATGASALQLVTPNRMRGIATSIFVFVGSAVGLGLAPTAVALVTDLIFQDEARVGEALPLVCGLCSLAAVFVLSRVLRPYRELLQEQRGELVQG